MPRWRLSCPGLPMTRGYRRRLTATRFSLCCCFTKGYSTPSCLSRPRSAGLPNGIAYRWSSAEKRSRNFSPISMGRWSWSAGYCMGPGRDRRRDRGRVKNVDFGRQAARARPSCCPTCAVPATCAEAWDAPLFLLQRAFRASRAHLAPRRPSRCGRYRSRLFALPPRSPAFAPRAPLPAEGRRPSGCGHCAQSSPRALQYGLSGFGEALSTFWKPCIRR